MIHLIYTVKVHTPLVLILLYTFNGTLYQVKMERVVADSDIAFNDEIDGPNSSPSSGVVGIFDTGTSLLLGPFAKANAFARMVGANLVKNGMYVLNSCDDLSNVPSLAFIINGHKYVISGSDLVVKMVRPVYSCSGNCLLFLMAAVISH